MNRFRELWKNLNWSRIVPLGVFVAIVVFFGGMIYILASYDPYSDPSRAGTIQCVPAAAEIVCDVRENNCGAGPEGDIRYYNGRFLDLVGHDGEGIIFIDENRRRVQLSNVACFVLYDEPR